MTLQQPWTAGDLRGWLLAHRRRRRSGAADWYVAVFTAVVLGAMAVAGAQALTVPLLALGAFTAGCCAGLCLTTLLVAGAVAWLVGPLASSPAQAFWVLSTPMDRADVLHRPMVRLVLLCVAAGLVAAALLWLVASPPAGWLVLAGLSAPTAVLLALLHQQHSQLQWLAVPVVAVMVVAGVLQTPWPAVVTLGLVALVGVLAGWRRLARLSRGELVAAGGHASGLHAGLLGADSGLLVDLVGARTTRPPRGRLRGRGTGLAAVAALELRRVSRRQPWALAVLVVVDVLLALLSPVVAHATAVAPVLLLPGFACQLTALRRIRTATGLARLFPRANGTAWALTAGGVVAGIANSVALAGLLVALGHQAPLASLVAACAANLTALLGARRLVTGSAPDFSTGLVMTDAGQLPLGAILTALRGWDVVLVATALQLLA